MWGWILFHLFVLGMLVLDIKVIHPQARQIKIREALLWSVLWVILALLFNLGIYWLRGPGAALQFLTGYLIERSLSIDNIFIFLLIFSYFRVPDEFQHKILLWGILGALLMRGLFILIGVTLISKFSWVIYLFGLFLTITGIKMCFQQEVQIHPESNWILRLVRKYLPVSQSYEQGRLWVRKGPRIQASMMLLVLIFIETTDVMFAFDSIPAILGITPNLFIAYTSNVFAIFGLRALYFAIAGMMRVFHYLNYGLAAVLVFIGLKMLISKFYEIPIGIALGVVCVILVLSIGCSLGWPPKQDFSRKDAEGERSQREERGG